MEIEETRRKYKDIINLERPVHENDFFSAEHPKMDAMERAKIFAPFSALRGLNKTLNARIRIPKPANDLTPEREEEINRLLMNLSPGDIVTAIIRTPVQNDEGSDFFYERLTGAVAKIKPEEGYIQLISERIPLSNIYDISLS